MEGEGIDLPQDEYDGNALREDCYVAKVARVVKAGHVAKCEKTVDFHGDGVVTSETVAGMKPVDFDDVSKYPSQMMKFGRIPFRYNMT